MSAEQTEKRRVRFHLRTLLLSVAFFGIVAAWFADRSDLRERLRKTEGDLLASQMQVDALQEQLSVHYGAVQTMYWWADADEFIQMLKTTSDEEDFLARAPSLAQSETKVLQDSISQLLKLLRSRDERTRVRALITLRFVHEIDGNRIADTLPDIADAVVPLLDDPSTTAVAEAIATLQAFGPAAINAVEPLQRRMSDDRDWYAPDAAIAIARIDPTTDVGSRLTTLVRTKHPNWYQAAFHLPQHVDAETARRVLQKAFDDTDDEGERNMLIQAMNQIPTADQQRQLNPKE